MAITIKPRTIVNPNIDYFLALTSLDLVHGSNDEFNLPNHVINVMRESTDECLWLVRLHPQNILSHLDSLVKYFDNFIKDKICILENFSYPNS